MIIVLFIMLLLITIIFCMLQHMIKEMKKLLDNHEDRILQLEKRNGCLMHDFKKIESEGKNDKNKNKR